MLKKNGTKRRKLRSIWRSHLIMVAAVALPLLFFTGNACADGIVLQNGDTLTGTVVKLQGGKLTMKTDYAGAVEVNAAKIKSIFTDKPVEVYTTSGETLKGTLKGADSGKIAVELSPDRKETRVDWRQVSAINPSPEGVWKGNVTVGGNQQSGDTDRRALSIGASAMRRTKSDRFSFGFLFNYGDEEDELVTRNTYGSAKYDYFFTKKLYGYLVAEFLNDKFQDIKLRTIVGPGMGYQIWDDPVKALAVEAGASYFSDNMRRGEDSDYITARLGLNFRYTLFKFIVFTDSLVYHPSLERFSTYTLRNDGALTTPLGARWALKLANILQYNSRPSPGIVKTDKQWILGLQYLF